MRRTLSLILALAAVSCGDDDSSPNGPSSTGPTVSFFVTSVTSSTGNLGGLAGADARCQSLAAAAGHGARTWRAYLSAERDPANSNQPTHAKDRIGTGPWYNANLALVANSVTELHARSRRCRSVRRRARPAYQRAMDRFAISGRARHPHRLERRRDARCRAHVRGLDVDVDDVAAQVGHSDGLGPQPEHHGNAVVVELRAHEPELC